MGESLVAVVKFERRTKKGGKKGFETGAEDDGFYIYSGVVKNMTIGQEK